MKERTYLLNILLAVVVGAACAVAVLVDTFAPFAILPHPGIPLMVLLTVLPLAAEYYIGAPKKRDWVGSTVLAGLTFAVLPACSGMTGGLPLWKLFVVGAVVFALVTVLYTSMGHRMRSGAKAKAAPAVNALLLFLAAQFFQGIL